MISRMPLKSRMPLGILMIVIFSGMAVHLFSNPDFKITQDIRTVIYSILFALIAAIIFIDAFRLIRTQDSFIIKIIYVGILTSTLLFLMSLILKIVQIT
jgi:hypothetical protein